MIDLTQQINDAKIHEWEKDEDAEGFFSFAEKILDSDKSILRICLMFSMMMTAHKPDVTWLDEIAEALRNCVDGLNTYKIMRKNWPVKVDIKIIRRVNETEFKDIDKINKLVDECMRSFNYSIGIISYRLMHLSKDEDSEMKKLSKLNILQGGIEPRFIPSLSHETKIQIEGSFKITQDK